MKGLEQAQAPGGGAAHPSDDPLRRDVRTLGYELGRVLRKHGSEQLFQLVEQIRALSKARRAGDPEAEQTLRQTIAELDTQQLRQLIRALACFFDLANIAEDRHRVRVLRQREHELGHEPQSESIGAALGALKADGHSPQQIQQILRSLEIDLVFTAHPTEAKRRTVRNTLGRLRQDLVELDRTDLLPRERTRLIQHIKADLACLWETDPLRPRRPSVLGEVRRSLFLVDSLWDIGPWLAQAMRQGLEQTFGDAPLESARFLRFSSWIGGDRDGNPFVTPEITRSTLQLLRSKVLEKHRQQCQRLSAMLSVSRRHHAVSPQLLQAIEQARKNEPALDEQLASMHPDETYRLWLAVIAHRLQRTEQADPYEGTSDAAYSDARQLHADVELIYQSLHANGHDALAQGELRDWLDRIDIFGFHLARLDIRDDARKLQQCVNELAGALGLSDDAANLDEPARQQLLATPLDDADPNRIDLQSLSEPVRETVELFELLYRTCQTFGKHVLGAMIASMTHQPSDILAILWLSRVASRRCGGPDEPVPLPVVPLFETVDDLKHADQILQGLFAHASYREHVRRSGPHQFCMIGYSDSTKDGGYLPANWQLYEAQRRLAAVGKQHDIELVYFHGRGGSLGRGGGPAARGILALPSDSMHGKIRMTEQGEVLAERYDDPQIAHRHLEQVTWATMLMAGRSPEQPPEQWLSTIHAASEKALSVYRALIEDPAFMSYFQQASPIDTIESLPIASRPSRRKAATRTLADLRAIPYTFAWTQNRHLLTAFFGLGSGLEAGAEVSSWQTLAQMYQQWPFFRATIDNAELALAKCDIAIAEQYASLVGDTQAGQRIFEQIRDEYQRSRQALLRITARNELLEDTPWLQRSIRVRNPYVDPLNFVQVELMRRIASADDDAERESLQELLRLTVQGIAAGLRTTG